MSFLDDHEIICWDIDGTLLANTFANTFREYIRTHPEKRHVLVTFRDPQWASLVYEELSPSLDKTHFHGLHSCPVEVFAEAMVERPLPDAIAAFCEWKGKIAASIGGTVLVDDMADYVLPGCQMHNVGFVHAKRPFGYTFERKS